MSLFDYLNNDSLGSASSSSQIALLLQQVAAQKAASTSRTPATAASNGLTGATTVPSVLITLDAQRANAAAADASKDAASLTSGLRSTLDAQYAGGGKTPDMSAFSGRALAIVALNKDGGFSRGEVDAAKDQLRARDRASALAFISSGDLTAASLKTYSEQLLAARQSMSAEEQQLRDSDPSLR